MDTLITPAPGRLVLPGHRKVEVAGDTPVLTWRRDLRRARYRGHDRGAVTLPGLFIIPWKDLFDGSDMVLDWVNDTCKYALFTNSITPNFSTNTAYGAAPYNANEVSGTGYTAGGASLASKTITESPTGTLMFDAADPSWTTATFSSARAGLVWDDTIASPTADPVIALQDFDADFGVTAGTFTVQFDSAGIFNDDLTPAS